MQLQYLKVSILIFTVFLFPFRIESQIDISEMISEGYLLTEEGSLEELIDLVESYSKSPLIWRSCSKEEIEQLPINTFIKELLIESKNRNKNYENWVDFRGDLGVSITELEAIKMFISLEEKESGAVSIKSYTSLKNQYKDRPDLARNQLRSTFTHPSGWFVAGIVERDESEPAIWDLYNFTARLPKIRDDLEIIGGSYRIHWGYGLIFSTNLMSTRGCDAISNLTAGATRYSNYYGTDENRYLFGTVAKYKKKKLEFSAFLSNHNLDASIDDSSVTSIRVDGIHITDSQLSSKDILNQKLGGLSFRFTKNHNEISALTFASTYSLPISFYSNSSKSYGISIFHKYRLENLSISGEFAVLSPKKMAVVETFIKKIPPAAIGISYRYLSPGFFPLLGYPPKKYSGYPENEQGVYIGLNLKLGNRWTLSSYADFYSRIISINEGSPIPKGDETFIGIRKDCMNGQNFHISFKRSIDYKNTEGGTENRYSLKFRSSLYITNNVMLTLSFANTRFKNYDKVENGTAISFSNQIIINSGTSVTLGSSHFYSPSYDSRIYLYEQGIPLRFNVTCLHGTGYRVFVVFTKRLSTSFQLSIAGKLQFRKEINDEIFRRTDYLEFQLNVDL